MKLLLDVSALVALLWKTHVHHQRVIAWSKGKTIVLCPIAELGFIRVSTSPAYNLPMNDARKLLADLFATTSLSSFTLTLGLWTAYQPHPPAKALIGIWLIW